MNVNVFFEIADTFVGKYRHKYLALYDADNMDNLAKGYRLWEMTRYAERVWSEEDDCVKFIKNRRTEKNNTPVDMKEFFWIKLRSQAL